MTVRRTEALRTQVQAHLQAFAVQSLRPAARPGDTPPGHAAVAVAIVDEGHGAAVGGLPAHAEWSEEAALVLTRRALHLRNHPGQWALPGGRVDEGETPESAALRELEEEVGLVLGPEAVLGRLDDFSTRSGFVITPVVVWGGPAPLLVANPGEVDSIHRIPVSEFLRSDAPRLENVASSVHPVLRMPVGSTWIAAPTAAVLYQFREVCLRGLPTRVSHFEQPAFAWK
ncbi:MULTISPECIES: CoA pyrophosphatase [Aquincola]|uniref:NUDIX hydrolase n=1 Tax=Aquincola TaxID=391952 RepID=UPI000614DF45|nr:MULTISPECIES: CoA pyrophosphatase [Aquincola]MCR5867997.1 CoA pyrophosphatase [Aquincola sp. J276]